MAKQQLKPKDKVVVRMTQDGAVEDHFFTRSEMVVG